MIHEVIKMEDNSYARAYRLSYILRVLFFLIKRKRIASKQVVHVDSYPLLYEHHTNYRFVYTRRNFYKTVGCGSHRSQKCSATHAAATRTASIFRFKNTGLYQCLCSA